MFFQANDLDAPKKGILTETYPLSLNGRHNNATACHWDDDQSIIDVIIAYPQKEAQYLKDVKGIQYFKSHQSEKALGGNDYLVAAINTPSHRLLRGAQGGQ